MVAIKIEFVSSKFQAFSNYNLICGENCVLCRLSAIVCFLSGMIVLLMGNSLNLVSVLSFDFFLFLFLNEKKKCIFGTFCTSKKYIMKITLERKI